MMKAHVVNIDVLGMSLIFTDFNIAHGLKPLPVGKSVNIRAILGILEKFQHSPALPNIKYNCAVLFWSQLY